MVSVLQQMKMKTLSLSLRPSLPLLFLPRPSLLYFLSSLLLLPPALRPSLSVWRRIKVDEHHCHRTEEIKTFICIFNDATQTFYSWSRLLSLICLIVLICYLCVTACIIHICITDVSVVTSMRCSTVLKPLVCILAVTILFFGARNDHIWKRGWH